MFNVAQIRPEIDPMDLSNEEILMAHMTCHAYYKEFRLGRGKEHWSMEEVVQKHEEIREEIEMRDDVEHDYISALDNESVEAVQAMEVEMGHKEDTAKEWAKELLQADDVDQHIRENPPSADWYNKAVEFVEQEDATLDLTEHVSFAAQSYESLNEEVQEWVEQSADAEAGVVGYYLNESTETGVLFLKDESEYKLYADTLHVESSESQTEVLDSYNTLIRLVQDGARAERARNVLLQEEHWVTPDEPEDVELEDPETDWDEVDTSVDAYLQAEDTDAENWEEASDEVRQRITAYHSASSSGVPAESFEDLWGPQCAPGGRVVYDGISQLKASNSGVDENPETPQDIRDDIEAQLNGYIEQFSEEYDDIEVGSDEVEQGEVFDGGDDFEWYIWDEDEVGTWLQTQGIEAGEPERQGHYLSYPVSERRDEYDDIYQEWRGPMIPPYQFVPELDEKPYLVTLGSYGNHMYADLLNVKFLVERPPQFEEIDQAKINQDYDQDWYWYQWDRNEIDVWLREREYNAGVGDDRDGFLSFEVNSPDRYDQLDTTWEGRRSPPDEPNLPGGEKPRRVVYGQTEDGDREVQRVDFLTNSQFTQGFLDALDKHEAGRELLERVTE